MVEEPADKPSNISSSPQHAPPNVLNLGAKQDIQKRVVHTVAEGNIPALRNTPEGLGIQERLLQAQGPTAHLST